MEIAPDFKNVLLKTIQSLRLLQLKIRLHSRRDLKLQFR